MATGLAGVRRRTTQGPILTALLRGRAGTAHALLTVGYTMGRSRLALLEAALSGSHGRTGSPHLRRVHPESMDVTTAGMGVRSTRA